MTNTAPQQPIIYFSHGNILKGSKKAKRCLAAIKQRWPNAKVWNPANVNIKAVAAKAGGWDRFYDKVCRMLQESGGHMVVLENGDDFNLTVGRGVMNEVSVALRCVVEIPVYTYRGDDFYRVTGATPVDVDDWSVRYGALKLASVA